MVRGSRIKMEDVNFVECKERLLCLKSYPDRWFNSSPFSFIGVVWFLHHSLETCPRSCPKTERCWKRGSHCLFYPVSGPQSTVDIGLLVSLGRIGTITSLVPMETHIQSGLVVPSTYHYRRAIQVYLIEVVITVEPYRYI